MIKSGCRTPLASPALLVLVLLAACGTVQPTKVGAPAATDTTMDVATPVAGDPAQPGLVTSAMVSPLNFYLSPDSDPGPAWFADQEADQQIIADCMAEQGFQYRSSAQTPAQYNEQSASNYLRQQETLEWVSSQGYGISTGSVVDPTYEPPVDPNDEVTANLSPQQQRSWEVALNGDPFASATLPEAVIERGDQPGEVPNNGCQGLVQDPPLVQADMDANNARIEQTRATFVDLVDAAYDVSEQVEKVPEIAAANAAWAACMEEAGHPNLDNPGQAREQIWTAYADLIDLDMPTLNGGTSFLIASPGEDVDQEALTELQTQELATATADHTCQIPYLPIYLPIRDQLEYTFINDHRDELDRYRAFQQNP